MKPNNFPERLIWYSIIATYGLYLIGGLYVWNPVIPWILLLYLAKKLWEQNDATPESEKIIIPWVTWVWIAGMLVEEIALIVGHLDFDLGYAKIIKSSVGWAKGWALLALFPLIGSLKIRPQLISRAVCIVCFHSLLLAPILYVAYVVHLRGYLYTSPLRVLGGAGDLFFTIRLYLIDSEGQVRWPFFAPWGPAIGQVGVVYFFIALLEKNKKWRWCGLIGAFLLTYMSKSRMATLFLPVVFLTTWGLTKMARPFFLIMFGFGSALTGIAAPVLQDAAYVYWQNFRSGRTSSTEVRESLQSIALYRWWNDAPIWGHGVVEEGPHLVQFMPIGSHHTIFALLFVKGIVGLVAFIVPMVCSFIDLLVKAQKSQTAAIALSIVLVLACYAFGENLEMLAYLYWPGLVIMGLGFNEKLSPSQSEETNKISSATVVNEV